MDYFGGDGILALLQRHHSHLPGVCGMCRTFSSSERSNCQVLNSAGKHFHKRLYWTTQETKPVRFDHCRRDWASSRISAAARLWCLCWFRRMLFTPKSFERNFPLWCMRQSWTGISSRASEYTVGCQETRTWPLLKNILQYQWQRIQSAQRGAPVGCTSPELVKSIKDRCDTISQWDQRAVLTRSKYGALIDALLDKMVEVNYRIVKRAAQDPEQLSALTGSKKWSRWITPK